MVLRGYTAQSIAIQGGLSDQFLQKKLGIDTGETLEELVKAQKVLSKYTHIEPETFQISTRKTSAVAEECLEAAAAFVELTAECRLFVRNAVLEDVNHHLIKKVVSHGLEELGEIATHGWLDGFWIEEVIVDEVMSSTVKLSVEGTVEVGLQYGSDGDVKRDMGVVTSDSFPFEASISVDMKRLLGKHATVDDLKVNIDSFYE